MLLHQLYVFDLADAAFGYHGYATRYLWEQINGGF